MSEAVENEATESKAEAKDAPSEKKDSGTVEVADASRFSEVDRYDVIAVSAVDGLGQPYTAGNQGDYVDVAAPGVGLWINDGAGSGRRVSGR